MTSKELITLKEQRAKLITDMRALNTPEMSEEQSASYNKMDADFDKVSDVIRREEKILAQEAKFTATPERMEVLDKATGGKSEVDPEMYMEVLGAWFQSHTKKPTTKVSEFAQHLGFDLYSKELEAPLMSTRDYRRLRFASAGQSAIQGTRGGYLVPTTMVGDVEIARLEHGNVRQVADVIRTAGGGPLEWPTIDDTANTGRVVGENAARTVTDLDGFGKKVWQAYTISSDIIKVPLELMEDSAFNVAAIVADLMGERLAETEGQKYTTGTGANEPQGIVTGSVVGNTTAAATLITLNEMHNLAYEVPTYYRRRGSYMMHSSIKKYVMQLVDGTGQYLWQPSIQAGAPDVFRGYKVYENDEMQSTVSASTKTMLFGDLSKYKIRDVGTIRIVRLNELYAANGQTGFMSAIRTDGGILNAGQNPIKHMLQAA